MFDTVIDYVFDQLFPIIGLMVPGYFVLQAWLLYRLRGGWRVAAMVPLIPFVPLLIHALFAFAMGSNLWPLLLILFAPFGFLYLAGVWIAHSLRG
jgi:hypothetical protein